MYGVVNDSDSSFILVQWNRVWEVIMPSRNHIELQPGYKTIDFRCISSMLNLQYALMQRVTIRDNL